MCVYYIVKKTNGSKGFSLIRNDSVKDPILENEQNFFKSSNVSKDDDVLEKGDHDQHEHEHEEHGYKIKLNKVDNSSSGSVYVESEEELGFLCRDGFTSQDARVVCRQLGYSNAISYNSISSHPYHKYLTNHPILANLNCTGNEDEIGKCPGFQFDNHTSCSWHASVVCYNDTRRLICLH
ncbi:neurotrypsin-like [Dreissena polymorpha]|uniref:neurotrypsin-like n=1 Tax=Dreissena polymorpha TaxID=45954 RepID=UPI0022649480|nr:neurotrypsin-like [Dreissena polymorpha]